MDTTPQDIFSELKRIAPNIAFAVEWEGDSYHSWDGDGPDPREEGYSPYNVTVSAKTIAEGEEVEGSTSLGGVYDKPNSLDPDVHGYLPQMLHEATYALLKDLPDAMPQALEAAAYLERVMRARRNPTGKRPWSPRRPKE